MEKFLCTALIVFALSFMPCGAAFADEALMKSMTPGTWVTNPRCITFGSYNGHALKWRVLEVKDGIAFLLLDDVLRKPASEGGGAVTMAFDGNSNAFPDSTIKAWLNGTFLNTAFAANEQDAILETNYSPDNTRFANKYTWTEGKSKVFLLSIRQATNLKYFKRADHTGTNTGRAIADDYEHLYYWLRSPGNYNLSAAVVGEVGQIYYDGNYVRDQLAVRPAFKIDISSPVFTSAVLSEGHDRLNVKSGQNTRT